MPDRDRYVISVPYGPLDGAGFAGRKTLELPTGDPRVRVWKLLD